MNPSIHRRLHLVLLCVGLLGLLAVHGPLIGYRTYANVDEAYAMALASRLLDGFKLYDGAISQRGPAMYYFYELLAKLHGWDNVLAVRLWALALAAAHLLLVDAIARRFLSRSAHLVALACSCYQLIWGFPAFDGAALHGEVVQLVPLLGSVWIAATVLTARREVRHRGWLLACSGILLGSAIAIKQSVILHAVPIGLWLVVDFKRRRRSPARLVKELLLFGAGTTAPVLLSILNAWRDGTLAKLYYYCVVYNREVHLRPTHRIFPVLANVFTRLAEQTTFFAALVLLSGLALVWATGKLSMARAQRSFWPFFRDFGAPHFFALHLFFAVLTASSMWRFFPHYFLQAAPFLSLCVGAATRRVLPNISHSVRTGFFAALIAFLALCATFACIFGERVDGRITHDRSHQDVARYIEATTNPEDRIFVWGFSPTVYGYSHRRPASRFVFETYVTGMVPWFWEELAIERARIVPGSMQQLIGDLTAENPPVVVDAGSIMLGRSMRLYPESYAWLRARYCFEMRLGAFDVYRRNDLVDGDCSHEPFPFPSATISWNGAVLPPPIPMPLDKATMRKLPSGNYTKPLWFRGGRTPPQRGLDAVRDPKVEREEKKAEDEGFYIPRIDESFEAVQ